MRYLHPPEERGSIVVSIAVARERERERAEQINIISAAMEWLVGRSAGLSVFNSMSGRNSRKSGPEAEAALVDALKRKSEGLGEGREGKLFGLDGPHQGHLIVAIAAAHILPPSLRDVPRPLGPAAEDNGEVVRQVLMAS